MSMRLDLYMLEKGISESRNKAQEAIKSAQVFVDGRVCTKASLELNEKSTVEVLNQNDHVSRAADKLQGFLKQNPSIKIEGKECLDIGSSTGGFVQILLKNGASRVTCIDVGKDQLHSSLRQDPRVDVYEQTDIRVFQADKTYDVLTCDVSFISLDQIIANIDELSRDIIIILFKPQFEVGKGIKRNKKGVVKDKEAIKRVMSDFEAKTFAMGWKQLQKEESIVKGKEGNEEMFYYFTKR